MESHNNELLELFYTDFDNNEYKESLEVLEKMVFDEKDSPWIYAKMGECYYELRNYKEAIRLCKESLKLQSNYPLPLWTISNAYYYNKDYKNSKRFFKKIVEMDEKKIGKEETSLGIRWAKSLKMDSYIKLTDCCYMLGQDKKAKDYLTVFNSMRSRKIPTSLPKWYIKQIKANIANV